MRPDAGERGLELEGWSDEKQGWGPGWLATKDWAHHLAAALLSGKPFPTQPR